MKILVIIDSLGDSGQYFLPFFENIMNRGYHFSVISIISNLMCNKLSRLGVDHLNLGYVIKNARTISSLEGLVFFPLILTKILRIIDSKKIHLIHVHSAWIPLLLGCIASRIKKVPLVLTIHGGRPSPFMRLSPISQAHGTISTSLEIKEGLRKCNSEVVVIPNIINLDRFSPNSHTSIKEMRLSSEKDTYKILLVSRLDFDKMSAVWECVEAAPKISEAIRNVQIIIAGDGSRAHEVKEAVRKINREVGREVIVLTGFVEDVAKLMKLADIIIGVGVVVEEAMACGKPVIVAGSLVGPRGGSFGGIVTDKNVNELRKYNFSGRNSTVRTDAANIFISVTRLLKDEEYRNYLGTFGRKFAEKECGPDKIVKRVESAYRYAQVNAKRGHFPSLVLISWALLGMALCIFAKHACYLVASLYMKLRKAIHY